MTPAARALLALAACSSSPFCTAAGIATDGSTGPAVRLTGPQVLIPPTLGTQRGGNLFHSFASFGIASGESATFTTTSPAVQHIVARVTGDAATTLDGRLVVRAEAGGSPALWLINPQGVAVGPNARFDLAGALHLATASELRLADGSRWATSGPATSSLSAAAPQRFGFVGPAATAALSWRGAVLAAPAGAAVELAGGSVSMDGGRIATTQAPLRLDSQTDLQLAGGAAVQTLANSATQPGQTDLTLTAARSVTLTGGSSATTRASATATASGLLHVQADQVALGGPSASGAGSTLRSTALGDASSGGVLVRGGSSVTVSAAGSIVSDIGGSGRSGPVEISAARVTLASDDPQRAAFAGSSATFGLDGVDGRGTAGSVVLKAADVELLGNASVGSVTGQGQAGDVLFSADRIRIDGRGLEAAVRSQAITLFGEAPGQAGRIVLQASDSLDLRAGGVVAGGTSGRSDNTGAVHLQAGRVVIDGAGANNLPTGVLGGLPSVFTGETSGASITVDTRSLLMTGGAVLATESRGGADASPIRVQADRIDLSGGAALFSSADGSGNGGHIELRADTVRLSGELDGRSTLLQTSSINGRAGDIGITARQVEVTDGAKLFSATLGNGQGGTLRVDATQIDLGPRSVLSVQGGSLATPGLLGRVGSIELRAERLQLDDAKVAAENLGDGPAGRVSVEAASLRLQNFSSISGNTLVLRSGAGSTVDVRVTGLLDLGSGSVISSTSYGDGRAGDITIRAGEMALSGFGSVYSDASLLQQGRPGRVNLTVDGALTLDKGSQISVTDDAQRRAGASSAGGQLVVNAGRLQMTGALISASGGDNAAGQVQVHVAGPARLTAGSQVATASRDGNGGPIDLRVGGTLLLHDARIVTSVFGVDNGNGGDINVAAGALVLRSGFVQANTAAPRASGGTVTVNTPVLLPDGSAMAVGGQRILEPLTGLPGSSVIQAAAPDGVGGRLSISLPALNVAAGLAGLRVSPLQAERVLRDWCDVGSTSALGVSSRGAVQDSLEQALRGLR